MRPRILISIALFVCAVALVALVSTSRSAKPQLSFALLGYSNSPSGERFAILAVTNQEKFTISFGTRGTYIWFDSTNTPVGSPSSTERTPDIPGESSQTVFVSLPPHEVRCSVEVYVSRATPMSRLVEKTGLDRWHLPFVHAPSVYGIRTGYIIE